MLTTREVSLGEILPIADRAKWALSPGRRHVAYAVLRWLQLGRAVDALEGKEGFAEAGLPHRFPAQALDAGGDSRRSQAPARWAT